MKTAVIYAMGLLLVVLLSTLPHYRQVAAVGVTPTVNEYLPMTLRPFSTPTPTILPTPFPTNTPTAPSPCAICSYDAYNCTDFDMRAQAQACFEYCLVQVGYDVHRLDGDHDGVTCEALP